MTRILLAPSADLARSVLRGEDDLATGDVLLTVEAEYGAFVAEGKAYTAAHHQPAGSQYAGTHVGGTRPSPCNDPRITPGIAGGGLILISHIDLDSIGGCLRALPGWEHLFAPEHASFWKLAEWVDVRGAHKLGKSGASEGDLRRLHAFWAWSKKHGSRPARDIVTDWTPFVQQAGDALARIFAGDEALMADGDALRAAENDLNRRTFHRFITVPDPTYDFRWGRPGGPLDAKIIVRFAETSRDFCNHLYVSPSGEVAHAVACYNHESGSITISLADPVEEVSCREIVQRLWGPEAGGHDGIAGSPREKRMDERALWHVVHELERLLPGRVSRVA